MFHFIPLTVLLAIIFEPCIVTSTENGIAVNRTDLTKIEGGSEVDIDKYPFIVSLQLHVPVRGKKILIHICGGSLIRADWVLTAAHCLLYKDESYTMYEVQRVRHPKRFSVLAGVTDVAGVSLGHPNRRDVRSTHINKYYNPSILIEDIGLMKLDSKFDISQQIQLTRLPKRSSTYDNLKSTACIAIGWGLTSRDDLTEETRAASNVDSDFRSVGDLMALNNLKSIDLEILTMDKCKEKWGFKRSYMSNDFQVCVEVTQRKAVLPGDSGSPLLCRGIQIGIASYMDARKRADKFKPSVYARVDFYLDWINATISTANALRTSRGTWLMNYAIVLALAVALKQI